MTGRTDGRTGGRTDGQTDGQADRRTGGRTDGRGLMTRELLPIKSPPGRMVTVWRLKPGYGGEYLGGGAAVCPRMYARVC